MRRTLVVVTLMLAVAWTLSAQRQPPRTYGSPLGFGNILYPGTGTPPPFPSAQFQPGTSFAHALGSNIAGRANYSVPWGASPAISTQGQGRGGMGGMIVPFAYPVYTGGYGYQQPNVTYMVQQAAPPAPAPYVILNQNFGVDPTRQVQTETGMREYQASGPPPTPEPEPASKPASKQVEEKPTIYLLAFSDGTVYSSLAYWVEDGTVHYITTQHAHNRASLSLVDRALSDQLNRERGVEFKLPAK